MKADPITEAIMAETEMIVLEGPFAGTLLTNDVSWGTGDLGSKLLGMYEQELHPTLVKFAARSYGAVVDVGCAEGYYAVGLAKLFPGTPVYAYDSNQKAIEITGKTAALNNVRDRLCTGGRCGPDELLDVIKNNGRSLIMCDCEGYEEKLFSAPELVGALRSSDLIIECHDFINPRTTAELVRIFSGTHRIELVYSGARNPNKYGFLSQFRDRDRWNVVSENRPCLMHWMILESKTRKAPSPELVGP